MNQENLYFPETYSRKKLNEAYKEIPLTDDEAKLLRKYCLACANLYGIIPMKKVWEIVMSQNPEEFSRKQLQDFATVARHETDSYFILGEDEIFIDGLHSSSNNRSLYNSDLLHDETENFHNIMVSQGDKPYYIPEKKVLLRYHSPYYCEPTAEVKAMKAFIATLIPDDSLEARHFLEDLLYKVKFTSNSSEDMQNLFNLHKLKPTKAQLDEFTALTKDFANVTRMPANRGYTPVEIKEVYTQEPAQPQETAATYDMKHDVATGRFSHEELLDLVLDGSYVSSELRNSMLQNLQKSAPTSAPAKSSQKVGRNDPCPCGSGKKYKKCCGR